MVRRVYDEAHFAGVIFDFDGTIADTLPVCIEAFQHTFALHGGPQLDADGVRALFGPTEEGVLAEVLGEEADAALETYLDEYTRLHSSCPAPFPGMGAMLVDLHRLRVPLAIVTGKGPLSVRISLAYLGLSAYFDPVEAGSPRGSIKSEAMGRVAAAWGLEPGSIVSVGDHVNDVRHAHEAGTVPVAAAWAHPGSAPMLAAENPAELFASVGDFRAWLLPRVQPG